MFKLAVVDSKLFNLTFAEDVNDCIEDVATCNEDVTIANVANCAFKSIPPNATPSI